MKKNRKRAPGKGRGRSKREKDEAAKKMKKEADAAQMDRQLRDPAEVISGALEKMERSDEAVRDEDDEANKVFESYINRVLDLKDVITVTKPHRGKGKYANLYSLQLSEDCRMTNEEGQGCIRLVAKDKGPLAKALNIRNAKSLGVPDDKDFVLLDHNGIQIARVHRNIISEEDAAGWVACHNHFNQVSTGWAGGCQAACRQTKDRYVSQFRCQKAATSSGLADQMVIVGAGPENEGAATSIKVEYINPKEEKKKYGIGAWINRLSLDRKGIEKMRKKSTDTDALVGALHDVYLDALNGGYLHDRGWPQETIDLLSNSQEDLNLHMSFLEVDEGSSKCGIHHDPPSPLFALVAGPTVYKRDAGTGKWERAHNGGRLFLADGVFSLEYAPRDAVTFCGNWPHGITNMRQRGDVQVGEMKRFSSITFSRFARENMKKHGNYIDKFRPEWKRILSRLAIPRRRQRRNP